MKQKKYLYVILSLAVSVAVFLSFTVYESGNEYNSIEETENAEVIRITEEIAEIYPICPEVLQALIFYESSNQRTVISRWGDVGYMQVNPKWQRDRMK